MNRLRRKGKSLKPKETRGKFNISKSIKDKPKEVRKRETIGHWELDTVVSVSYTHLSLPLASLNAFTISSTLYPFPVPKLYTTRPHLVSNLSSAFK